MNNRGGDSRINEGEEEAEENKSKKMGKKVRRRNGTRNLIHIEEDIKSYIFRLNIHPL